MDLKNWTFLLALTPLLLTARSTTAQPAPQSSSDVLSGSGGLVTLLAHDDVRSSFNFETGSFGAPIVDGELILDGTQIVFHRLVANHISFGYFRHQKVEILDLGDLVIDPVVRPTDDAPKLPVSIFHTLYLDGSVFYYRGPVRRIHRLSGFDNFANGPMLTGTRHMEWRVGHTYVLRFKTDVNQTQKDGLVKIQVVDFLPDSRITFRWARL